MHFRIGAPIGEVVFGSQRPFHRDNASFHRRYRADAVMLIREFGGLALERDPERAERLDVVRARRESKAADLQLDHEKTRRLQQPDRLPHWRSADAERFAPPFSWKSAR